MVWQGHTARSRRVSAICAVGMEVWAALHGGAVQRFCARRMFSMGLLAHPGEDVYALATLAARKRAYSGGGDCIGCVVLGVPSDARSIWSCEGDQPLLESTLYLRLSPAPFNV